jgi:hypothetical protein
VGHYITQKRVGILFVKNGMKINTVLLQERSTRVFARAPKCYRRAVKLSGKVLLCLLKAIKNSVGNNATLFLS